MGEITCPITLELEREKIKVAVHWPPYEFPENFLCSVVDSLSWQDVTCLPLIQAVIFRSPDFVRPNHVVMLVKEILMVVGGLETRIHHLNM